MARTIMNSKQVFQSYVLATARYDFSSYEERIMYKLIELVQKEIKGIKLKDNPREITPTSFGKEIAIPVSDVLKDEQDKHCIIAKTAFRSLSEKHIEYRDDEVWSYTPIITTPEIEKNSGSAEFYVFDNIWRCLLDFAGGFKKCELITAMKLKSAYTMWSYGLMSGQAKPLFVPLEGPDGLHERFYLQGKCEKVNDFRGKAIDVARKELDESSSYSSVAKEEEAEEEIIGWTFFPVFYENREDPTLQEQARMAKITARLQLESNIYDYSKFPFGFKSDEINKNKKTLIEGQNRIPDFMGLLGKLKKGVQLAEGPKGYVIDAIKRKLKKI